MIPPPRPRSKNPFADAITMDEPSSRPKGSSRSHRRRSDSYSSYSSDSSKSFSDDDEYPSRSAATAKRTLDPTRSSSRNGGASLVDRDLEIEKRKERERRRIEEERRREKERLAKEEARRREKERRRREEERRREKERRRRAEEEKRRAEEARKPLKEDEGAFSFDSDSEDEAKKQKRREIEKEKERERRHRHRHRHHHHRSSSKERSRSSKSKSKSSSSKPEKKAVGVDTIDRLDVTGLFGGAFHHDGPFDACNPHRNKNTKQAPVMAFPVDGPNSTIKGLGPNNTKEHTIDTVLGKTPDENDTLYQTRINKERINAFNSPVIQFDAKVKEQPIHGTTTLGLGSSTFLEGAPASKVAVKEEQRFDQSQLGRKKSLSRRFLNNNQQPMAPRRKSDDEVLRVEGDQKSSLLNRVKSLKVSRNRQQV